MYDSNVGGMLRPWLTSEDEMEVEIREKKGNKNVLGYIKFHLENQLKRERKSLSYLQVAI